MTLGLGRPLGGGCIPGPPGVLEDVEIVADGLVFPEGPTLLPDGSVLVVEIHGGRISRVTPDGAVELVARCPGGPNGLAIGPDGRAYVCNNGGRWPAYTGGRIERVDLGSGALDVIFTEADGVPLSAPNDLVFDADGGLWFTDLGARRGRSREVGRLLYANPATGSITTVLDDLAAPNGIGLSADGAELYFTETWTARLHRRVVVGPGQVEPVDGDEERSLLCGLPGRQGFDSLAVDAWGRVCVGTLWSGCITVVDPVGARAEQLLLPDHAWDPMPTNLCFDARSSVVHLTLSETGRLARARWRGPLEPRLDGDADDG